MRLQHLFFAGTLLISLRGLAQEEKPSALMDTTVYDYDELFSELDALIDSLYTPRGFAVFSISAGNGFFQYKAAVGEKAVSKGELIFSPSLAVYTKSGFGAGASASFLAGGNNNPWQYSVTGSYDYLKRKSFIAGLSLSHHFIKEKLPFYTSPLQNEAFGYVTYRKHWLTPSVNASLGWGSRTAVAKRTENLKAVRKKKNNGNGNNNGGGGVSTAILTYEKIMDVNLQASVRHDFYFLHLFSTRDYVRLTPQVGFTAGSQQFGFNSLINTSVSTKKNVKSSVTTSQQISLDDNLTFRPLSLTAQLRSEYALGKIYVQPQLYVDYYFPAQQSALTTTFMVNAGLLF